MAKRFSIRQQTGFTTIACACFFLLYLIKFLFRLNPQLFNLCILNQALESGFGIEIIFFFQIDIAQ